MLKIEVLGPGCPKCDDTSERVRQILQEMKIQAELVEVTDVFEIIDRGVSLTPALIIDGQLIFQGKVPTREQITSILRKHQSKGGN